MKKYFKDFDGQKVSDFFYIEPNNNFNVARFINYDQKFQIPNIKMENEEKYMIEVMVCAAAILNIIYKDFIPKGYKEISNSEYISEFFNKFFAKSKKYNNLVLLYNESVGGLYKTEGNFIVEDNGCIVLYYKGE